MSSGLIAVIWGDGQPVFKLNRFGTSSNKEILFSLTLLKTILLLKLVHGLDSVK